MVGPDLQMLIRELFARSTDADVRKLIPVAVVVIAFISIFGLAAIILDLVQPINL